MSVGSELRNAVKDIAPVYPKVYEGSADHYFVYDIEDDRGDEWGDDDPEWIHYWIRLKFYYPLGENQTAMRDEVRDRLYEAGFTFASISELDVPEDGTAGLAWDCEYTQGRSN